MTYAQSNNRHIISVSGGMGSTISALLAMENKLNFDCVFADTLIEDEDLYIHLDQLQDVLRRKIVRVKDGRDPWQVFADKKWIGNTRTAHCSSELKTEQVKSWVARTSTETDVLVLGMDLSEMDRIERAQKNWNIPVVSLLNEFKFERPKWDAMFLKYGLTKPRLYKMGWTHNNCGGFCVRAGLRQFELLLINFPHRFAYHEQRMNEIMAKNPKLKPFLRKMENGKTRYITMTEFREDYEAKNINIDIFDLGGCGCFTSEK